VRILRGSAVVAVTTTDAFGRYVVQQFAERCLQRGRPLPGVSGGESGRDGGRHRRRDDHGGFPAVPVPISLAAVEVRATVPLAVDTRRATRSSSRTTTTRAHEHDVPDLAAVDRRRGAGTTGEVHIRGQHAEYTYYVDGVPVTAGISGSLNELFDPQVVNQIDFQTGGWDAEYGNKNTAVVNVTTRIPAGGFHLDAAGYDGSFNTNGQSLNFSTNADKVGLFFSGARQVTDNAARAGRVRHGQQTVEKLPQSWRRHLRLRENSVLPSDRDVINLDVNRSRTRFAVPFDSSAGIPTITNRM